MRAILRPLPRAVTRFLSIVVLIAWGAVMAVLVNRSYLQASVSLAADLGRYGSDAQWRGVYYRGAKIGFTVGQTVPIDGGFELQENGQLEMTLLGATTAAKIRTTARVDQMFALRSFEFSLDPGTGPIAVAGRGPFAVEVDLMQPIDPAKKPAVHGTPLNHVGLWVDDLPAAVRWLSERGLRFAPGGIRKGAAGYDICFVHPKGNDEFPLGGEGVLIELVQAPAAVVEALS